MRDLCHDRWIGSGEWLPGVVVAWFATTVTKTLLAPSLYPICTHQLWQMIVRKEDGNVVWCFWTQSINQQSNLTTQPLPHFLLIQTLCHGTFLLTSLTWCLSTWERTTIRLNQIPHKMSSKQVRPVTWVSYPTYLSDVIHLDACRASLLSWCFVVAGYLNFVNFIENAYNNPNLKYYLVCGPMIGNPCCTYVQNVVQILSQTILPGRVKFINLQGILTPYDLGCNGTSSEWWCLVISYLIVNEWHRMTWW